MPINKYYNTNNTHLLSWPALSLVPHHIATNPEWNSTIETFTPNQLAKFWPDVDLTKGYYANNPNDLSVVDDTITLDGLHYMHDNPAYEELFSDVANALKNEEGNQALFDALWDQIPRTYEDEKGGKHTRNREELRKFVSKVLIDFLNNKTTDETKDYVLPAIDGYLRRLLAPDYMRNLPSEKHGYDNKYPMSGDLEKATNNIKNFLESYLLPEITVTPKKKNGGRLKLIPKRNNYGNNKKWK